MILDKDILKSEVQDFLLDMAANTTIELIEEGKEKNDLIEIAKKRGIDLTNNRDLAGFKTIYALMDTPNKNKCILPKDIVEKTIATIIGKPVDIDHMRRAVIGHYLDAKLEGNKIITYGVFYKSNFADEWEEAKKLFKAGKLTTSFEIWCPKENRQIHSDGTYSLKSMEFSGGGLLFKTKPAFAEAKVLEVARDNSQLHEELVTASICCEDIIFSHEAGCAECGKCKIKKKVKKIEEAITLEQLVQEVKPILQEKIIECQNCKAKIDLNKVPEYKQGVVKCPKCFAILNGQTGTMILPPQIIDFNLSCLKCKAHNWEILANKEDETLVKCLSCATEFNILFNKAEKLPFSDYLYYAWETRTSCPQCSKSISFYVLSNEQTKQMKCDGCGLKFDFSIEMSKSRKIKNVLINTQDKINQMEGGNVMIEKLIKLLTEGTEPIIAKLDEYEGEDQTLEEALVNVIEDADEAKKLNYQEKKALSDDDYAVVLTVKNKVTGQPRKIRMFVIKDESHVRNALARLAQVPVEEHLKKLGVSKDEVMKKIMKRAEELNMKDLMQRHTEKATEEVVIPTEAVAPIAEVPEVVVPVPNPTDTISIPVETPTPVVYSTEVESIKKELEESKNRCEELTKDYDKKLADKDTEIATLKLEQEKALQSLTDVKNKEVAFYKENAKTIVERRNELGEFAKDMLDEEVLDETKYELAKVRKENVLLKSSNTTSAIEVSTQNDNIKLSIRQSIDKKVKKITA